MFLLCELSDRKWACTGEDRESVGYVARKGKEKIVLFIGVGIRSSDAKQMILI
jgi:hypothetical protein